MLFLYWVVAKTIKAQNLLLLGASYVFYGWWDPRFLGLIAFSSLIDFGVGLGLEKAQDKKKRRLLLGVSLASNLGLLAFFKYFNFFVDSFIDAFAFFGYQAHGPSLSVILPVGISFYTFQTLSYSIDIYRQEIKPTRDIVAFFAFVSFFPQLVAGPIERAKNLLPQFQSRRSCSRDLAVDGLRQVLWGLFKKIVIADNCALIVNQIFAHQDDCAGSTLWLGALLFTIQIYGDFSGYSDVAIGTAKLFGFRLMRNFATPFFARNMADFWRRWHISLSTWFRDYVYIPLGGSRETKAILIRNVVIVFLLSGLWHGAKWTFVVWGGAHALLYLPQILFRKKEASIASLNGSGFASSVKEIMGIALTFTCVVLTFVFFRSESLGQALSYLKTMFSASAFHALEASPETLLTWMLILTFLGEWLQREKEHALQLDAKWMPQAFRWSIYYGIITMILLLGGREQEFIYFQF